MTTRSAWYAGGMSQFTSGGGPTPSAWYDKNIFWGFVGLFFVFASLGVGTAVSEHPTLAHIFFWASWPWGTLAAWCAIRGLSSRRQTRILAIVFASLFMVLVIGLTDRALTKKPAPAVTVTLPNGLSLRAAIVSIVETDNASARFSANCSQTILGTKVGGGSISARSRTELINQLQYRLINPAATIGLKAVGPSDGGVYDIDCVP